MRPYELIILLHPDLEIDIDAPVTKIEKLVTQTGGKVVKRDNWGKRRLAYRVKKLQFAVYVYFELELEPGKVRELENGLLITEEVIRHLLVSKLAERPAEKPSEEAKPIKAAAAASKEKTNGEEL